MLSILTCLTFYLPTESGEKVSLGLTVLLAFSVFMLLIAEAMPATSEFIPLIGQCVRPSVRLPDNSSKRHAIGGEFLYMELSHVYLGRVRR